eukprot:TRINITY_DN8657_c0_g1_i2.p1 TRINITY_DN8657_c0_g1~~TRINITY_DN8657_c0_g1_i2.p1  ORF type:complete len:176 (+),score=25.92 TRINITY_DN8657_c0_g1_i2:43-570(+)
MGGQPPISTLSSSSAASDVYKRQPQEVLPLAAPAEHQPAHSCAPMSIPQLGPQLGPVGSLMFQGVPLAAAVHNISLEECYAGYTWEGEPGYTGDPLLCEVAAPLLERISQALPDQSFLALRASCTRMLGLSPAVGWWRYLALRSRCENDRIAQYEDLLDHYVSERHDRVMLGLRV